MAGALLRVCCPSTVPCSPARTPLTTASVPVACNSSTGRAAALLPPSTINREVARELMEGAEWMRMVAAIDALPAQP